ncbi:MAG: ABC transporter ATP-binding protein [Blastocatellia bacterium]|nr:ABC transporter ATP-binding protein [Blastocatellia bacterium]
MSTPIAIRAEELRKSFGKKEVLKDLSLYVRSGCLFGFLGENGAGKTTTMNILTGILLPQHGRVQILGETLTPENAPLRRRIGAVHDSYGLFEQMTGEEHLLFSASIHGLDPAAIPGRMRELFALLDLAEGAATRIHEYSHGMKKKLALACALIHDPEVLFLDEPFEGMDVLSARRVMENLRQLTRRGKTVFLTSHILEIVEKLCDEVAIVAHGQVAWQQDLKDLPADSSLEQVFLNISSGAGAKPILSWAR